MADIEKVIKGLEHCTSDGSTCDKCDYWEHNRVEDGPHCGDVLMRDALELLKKQLPRVLTYKEAKELKAGTDIWMEHKRDSTVTPLMFKSFTQGYTYKWFNFYGIQTQSIKAMFYGSSVRFWTSRPTDKQRNAVPWEEGNH